MNKYIKLVSIFLILLFTASLASAATLQVGPKLHYKTIQSAVNDANHEDTIKVAYGNYPEQVILKDKRLEILGQWSKNRYPTVYGIECSEGGRATINGMSFTKKGISCHDGSSGNYIRNNIFTNCGVSIWGTSSSDNVVMNCKVTGGTVSFYDSYNNTVTGCTFTKCNPGVYCGDLAGVTVTKNSFVGNKVGVERFDGFGYLIGNTYKNNVVNIKDTKLY